MKILFLPETLRAFDKDKNGRFGELEIEDPNFVPTLMQVAEDYQNQFGGGAASTIIRNTFSYTGGEATRCQLAYLLRGQKYPVSVFWESIRPEEAVIGQLSWLSFVFFIKGDFNIVGLNLESPLSGEIISNLQHKMRGIGYDDRQVHHLAKVLRGKTRIVKRGDFYFSNSHLTHERAHSVVSSYFASGDHPFDLKEIEDFFRARILQQIRKQEEISPDQEKKSPWARLRTQYEPFAADALEMGHALVYAIGNDYEVDLNAVWHRKPEWPVDIVEELKKEGFTEAASFYESLRILTEIEDPMQTYVEQAPDHYFDEFPAKSTFR